MKQNRSFCFGLIFFFKIKNHSVCVAHVHSTLNASTCRFYSRARMMKQFMSRRQPSPFHWQLNPQLILSEHLLEYFDQFNRKFIRFHYFWWSLGFSSFSYLLPPSFVCMSLYSLIWSKSNRNEILYISFGKIRAEFISYFLIWLD